MVHHRCPGSPPALLEAFDADPRLDEPFDEGRSGCIRLQARRRALARAHQVRNRDEAGLVRYLPQLLDMLGGDGEVPELASVAPVAFDQPRSEEHRPFERVRPVADHAGAGAKTAS